MVRGDSAYSRDDIMRWCEAQAKVEYVLAHASNARLQRLTWGLEQRAREAYEHQRQQFEQTLDPLVANTAELKAELDALVPPQVWYQSLEYRTQESWSSTRRVVCKLTYNATGVHRHFVVTSFSSQQISAGKLHADYYCPRGDMENRIKEHQLDLFSDRTSTHTFESNQLRLWFSSIAYVLMQALRQHGLHQTEFATAQWGTIRLKLLKWPPKFASASDGWSLPSALAGLDNPCSLRFTNNYSSCLNRGNVVLSQSIHLYPLIPG